jgi:hypothetical protein
MASQFPHRRRFDPSAAYLEGRGPERIRFPYRRGLLPRPRGEWAVNHSSSDSPAPSDTVRMCRSTRRWMLWMIESDQSRQ